jgi:hypothetical protein
MTLNSKLFGGALAILSAAILAPGTITVASLVVGAANESAGWMRYRLPDMFFWIFIATGVASPFLGIGTLVLLWLSSGHLAVDGTPELRRKKQILILAASAAVAAPAVWILVAGRVFFAAGGSR